METQVLEINLISAQSLKTPSANLRKIQTYAVTWINPAVKLRTRVDSLGGENPNWNDKFLFRVSDQFVSGDTSAVSVEIFAVGYVKDFLIGSVRFLLSTCLKKTTPRASAMIERSVGTPAFTAVQIRRPSGRFQGVLNIAAAVYYSSDYPILGKLSAVSFRDLMEKKERESRRLRRLSRGGSRRSQQSSGGESCDFSDGADSTTSSSSAASTALKEWNCVREMAGKMKGAKSDGGRLLCGLMMPRRFSFCPSDQNLDSCRDSFEENI